MTFFSSFKDANNNAVFNNSDVVGLMSMHSVGGVNKCSGNGNVNAPPWCSTATRDFGAYFDSTPDKLDSQYFSSVKSVAAGLAANSVPACSKNFCTTSPNAQWCKWDLTSAASNQTNSHFKNVNTTSTAFGLTRREALMFADIAM